MNNLVIKSMLSILNLAVIMGLMLFLPASTLDYKQAQIYLIAFFVPVIIITLYIFKYDKKLLQSRLSVGPASEKRIQQKIIQAIASLGFMSTYVIAGFDFRYKWSVVSNTLWICGLLLIVTAMVLMFFVFKKNSYLSALVEIQHEQKLISDGLYSVVRHPMYTAALLLFMATPLALASFYALLTLPLMIIVLALRSVDEEKLLKTQLRGYKEYCQKTRYRLFPGVW